MVSVYIAVRTGTIGITVVGLMIILFQYLIGELLTSERRGKELERVANTDELTGLANRERFRTQLEDRITRAGRAGESFAVMLLDLDRFKEINDTLGHHYGDQLLRELGPRLVECVGPDGIVARLGGDEFAVLPAEQTDAPDALERYAREIIEVVQRPFEVEQMTLQVGASVGIARFPRRRRRPAHAAAPRGRGDVRRQGRQPRRRAVRQRPGPRLQAAPEPAERLPARARERRARRPLPADRRRARRRSARRRGPRPLGAPRARAAAARRVHRGRRADRPDRPADPPRARALDRPVRDLAHRRQGPVGRGQPVGPQPDGPRPADADLDAARHLRTACRTPFSWRSPRA